MPTEQYSLWCSFRWRSSEFYITWYNYLSRRFGETYCLKSSRGMHSVQMYAASFLNIHLQQIESPWRRMHKFLPNVGRVHLYWTITRHNLTAGTVRTLVFTVTVLTIVGVIRNFFLQFEVAAVGVSVWRVGISRARTMPRTWRFLYDTLRCRAVDVGHFRLLSC